MSGGKFHLLMAVLLAVEILSSLEQSMVISALPAVMREFKGIGAAGWLVTIFLLAQAATAAVGGRLGDMFGRRRVLFVAIGLCAAGSLISAFGGSLEAIILGRALQGATGAILPLCYGITRETAPNNSAPVWIGILTGGYAFASAIGYILGGYLADIGSWRSVFYFTAGYALLLLPLLAFGAPVTRGAGSKRIDVVGAVLFAPAVAAVLYGISQGGKLGWADPGTWGPTVAGLAGLAFWAWYEARHDDPLIDVRLLKQPKIALGNVVGVLSAMGMMHLPLVTLLLMQQPRLAGVGLGVSAAMAGVLKLPSNVSSLAAAPLSGWISGRNGSRLAILLGASLATMSWTSLLLFHDTLLQVVVGTIVCAFASTMLLAAIPNLLLEGAPLERSSEVTGMAAVFRAMGSGVGAQTITMLLATSRVTEPSTGADFPSNAAYQLAFGFVVATSLLIALLCLTVRGRKPVHGPKAAASAARETGAAE